MVTYLEPLSRIRNSPSYKSDVSANIRYPTNAADEVKFQPHDDSKIAVNLLLENIWTFSYQTNWVENFNKVTYTALTDKSWTAA